MPESKTSELRGAEELYEAVKKFGKLNGYTKEEVVMLMFAATFPKDFQYLQVSKVMETF